jgi:uncharacterized protein YwqG
MGLFRRLFGDKGGDPPPPCRDVAALVAPLARQAVQLVKSSDETTSYLGGTPALPAGTAWPSKGGEPLAFLASLDLVSLSAALPLAWLPSSGRLLFFYDLENQPWGFDPKDRGSWTVMHAPGAATQPSPSPAASSLPRQYVSLRAVATLPSWQRPEVEALGLTEDESETLIDMSHGPSPRHHVGGFPDPIQGDEMELECQLVSHGLYCGDPSGYKSPEALRLQGGASDWRLLLQMDSDDDLGVMWGDAGILYFWIREEDARAGRFDKSWVVLQCH